MKELVTQINTWSKVRTVYWSLMKTAGAEYFHPTIFGNILLADYQSAINEFDDLGDIDKANYKDYFNGIAKEIAQSSPSPHQQARLKTYLTELDRRRGTDYTKTFPTIAELLKDVEI